MTISFVVDANVINLFQQERLADVVGPIRKALDAILEKSFIVLDDEGHCQGEWMRCAASKEPYALEVWIYDMLAEQKIRLYRMCPDSMHKELTALGLPKKDHKWVRISIGSGGKMIVTEDIDLFDPTKKGQPAKIVERIRQSRSGCVAKYLRKNYNIEVMCAAHVLDFV